MSTLNFEIKYPYDDTGIHADNLVVDEPFTLESSDSKYRILNEGPFYKDSVILKHTASAKTLIPSVDYHLDYLYKAATEKSGMEVYTLLHIKNPELLGLFTVSYQVVGGEFSTNVPVLQTVINQLLKDRRVTYFDDVINKPDLWEPSLHEHEVRDLIGMSAVVEALEDLNVTLANERDEQHLALLEELRTKADNTGAVKFGVENAVIRIENYVGQIRLNIPRALLNDNSLNGAKFILDIVQSSAESLVEYKVSGIETDLGIVGYQAGWIGNDSTTVAGVGYHSVSDTNNGIVFGDPATEWVGVTLALRSIVCDAEFAEHWMSDYGWEFDLLDGPYLVEPPKAYGMTPHAHSAIRIVDGVLRPERLPHADFNVHGAIRITNDTNSSSQSTVPTSQALKYVKDIALSKWTMVTATTHRSGIATLSNNWNGTSQVKPVTELGVKAGLDTKSDNEHKHDAADITSGILADARLYKTSLVQWGVTKLSNDWNSTNVTKASTPKALKDGLDTKSDKTHVHPASDLVSGTLHIDRLPKAGLGSYGLVRYTDSYASTSTSYAPTALALKNGLDTKSGTGHRHDASHVVSGILADARLPKASTTKQGITYLTNSWNGTSQTHAVTQKGVHDYIVGTLNPRLATLQGEIDALDHIVTVGWSVTEIIYQDIVITNTGGWINHDLQPHDVWDDDRYLQRRTITESIDYMITETHGATGNTRTKTLLNFVTSRYEYRYVYGTRVTTTYSDYRVGGYSFYQNDGGNRFTDVWYNTRARKTRDEWYRRYAFDQVKVSNDTHYAWAYSSSTGGTSPTSYDDYKTKSYNVYENDGGNRFTDETYNTRASKTRDEWYHRGGSGEVKVSNDEHYDWAYGTTNGPTLPTSYDDYKTGSYVFYEDDGVRYNNKRYNTRASKTRDEWYHRGGSGEVKVANDAHYAYAYSTALGTASATTYGPTTTGSYRYTDSLNVYWTDRTYGWRAPLYRDVYTNGVLTTSKHHYSWTNTTKSGTSSPSWYNTYCSTTHQNEVRLACNGSNTRRRYVTYDVVTICYTKGRASYWDNFWSTSSNTTTTYGHGTVVDNNCYEGNRD